MKECTIKAYGKLNLGLDVTGVRDDGYHLVRMVMQTVKLHDTLTFRKTVSPAIRITANLRFLPTGEGNLVYKAIDAIRLRYGISEGVFTELEKKIPVAAGMAGGSADAAAAICAMNRLFELSMTENEMDEIGLMLGADVPYCLHGGTMLAEGIGEKLTRLPQVPDAKVLIVKPDVGISTAHVYKALDMLETYEHPDIDGIVDAISCRSLTDLCNRMGNVLSNVTCSEYPEINDICAQMKSYGAVNAMMSGSGPSVFGIFTDRKAAQKAFYKFKGGKYGRATFLTGFISPGM